MSRKASSLASAKPASARPRSRARGKSARSFLNSRRSSPADAPGRRPRPRPQQRGHHVLDGLGVERHRDHQGQIAPGVVVAVEERELLLPVGRIVGRIEIDRDEPHARAQARVVVAQHGVGHSRPQPVEVGPAHGVLEARQGRLRAQGRAVDRIAVEQQLVDRVVAQPRGVVAVGVATGEPKDPLPEQLERLMLDLARLPWIVEARGQALGQPELGIDPLEQDRAAVGAGVLCVEDGDHRLPFRIEFERDLRYTVCSHRASFSWCERASNHRFYRTLERLDGCLVSSFTHNPG